MILEPKKRQQMIEQMLYHHDYLDVDDLAKEFSVTNQTIRRDLQVLTEKGIARRRHGGVERLVLTKNQTYISRQVMNSSAKHRIAAEVAKQIPNGASIAFSIGTTPEIVAQSVGGSAAYGISVVSAAICSIFYACRYKMIRILSWNIQSGLGCDGVNDLGRIVDFIRENGAPELICLQEISRNISEYSAPDQDDQLEYLKALLPEYSSHWGTGTSWLNREGKVEEFGNLTLSRIPVQLTRIHLLPRPPAYNKAQMQRVAVEVVLPVGNRLLRVINCHLAYHLELERRKQLEFLHIFQQWEEEAFKNAPMEKNGAYSHNIGTVDTVICGDFNFTTECSEYTYLVENGWQDGWRLINPLEPHLPTCGIFDHDIWPMGAHCRDFFWFSKDCCFKPEKMLVDQETSYSDHQPIIITLQER